jgi:integrase
MTQKNQPAPRSSGPDLPKETCTAGLGADRNIGRAEAESLPVTVPPLPRNNTKPTKRSRRGSGSVFQKPNSKHWVIQYYRYDHTRQKSVRVREYTQLSTRTAAQKLLTDRLSKVGRGEQFEIGRPITVAELYDALRTFTRNNGTGGRAVAGLSWRWKHLAPFFSGMRAANVTTDSVEKYKHQRRAEGAAPATVNRELAALRRAFNYGKRTTPPKVYTVPFIQMFKENNARQGFIEQEAFARMVQEANRDGLWMRALLELAYTYGWRRGELLTLRVRNVDLNARTIRLDPGTTKNREGREVVMTSDLEALIRAAVSGKQPTDHVFTRENGKPIKDFRGAWRNLCVRAGTGHWECTQCEAALYKAQCHCGGERRFVGPIPHDLRRSAAKAARRAGVAESVIMMMGGWKTPSMFRRYAIVSNSDLRTAADMITRERAETTPSPESIPQSRELGHDAEDQEIQLVQ